MRKLSSSMTWVMKYAFSTIWIGFFGLGTIAMLLNPLAETESSKWYFAIAFLFGTGMIYFMLMRLKKVSIEGNQFVVSNFREEIRVNIFEVKKVSGSVFCNPELVWLHLKKQTKFGNKIQFMAPQQFFSFRLTRHPLVEELNDLVKEHDFT